MVTAPPSVHATGQRYVWVPGGSPDELTPATVPGWLKGIAHREAGVNQQKPIHEQPARTTQEQSAFAEAWARTGIELESGDRYYLCPFHDDHHPSLHIDSEHCRWYCFRCRSGGGIGRLRRLIGDPLPPSPRARLRGHVGATRPVTLSGPNEILVSGESKHQDELLSLAGWRRPTVGLSWTRSPNYCPFRSSRGPDRRHRGWIAKRRGRAKADAGDPTGAQRPWNRHLSSARPRRLGPRP